MSTPVLLINMLRSPDRLAHMHTQFAAANLPFERVVAVDGNTLDEATVARCVPGPGTIRHIIASEVGCFLSHRQCWEAAVRNGGRGTVVFEDDIHLSPEAGLLLGDLSWIPEDADVVKIETTLEFVVLSAVRPIPHGRRLGRLRTSHFGTAGYIVTPSGARKLLAMSESFVDPADDFMFNRALPSATALASYQVFSALCMQDRAINGEAVFPTTVQTVKRLIPSKRPPGLWVVWRELRRALRRHTPHVIAEPARRIVGLRGLAVPFA